MPSRILPTKTRAALFLDALGALLLVDLASHSALAQRPLPHAKQLDHIQIEVEPKLLNPLRATNAVGRLRLTGVYTDASSGRIDLWLASLTAKTRHASGEVAVVSPEGDPVLGREGGVATLTAAVVQDGETFTASTDVVVAPYYRNYHQTLVLKLFLGMEGEPVPRLAHDPTFRVGHDVLCTFEEALEVIRKTDNLTRGIPKILYLVGWQKGGYDHGCPAWDEVNPRLKRAGDATALWHPNELMAYSRQGYTNQLWQLPADWAGVKQVDTYQVTMDGCVPTHRGVPVQDGKLLLTMAPDEALSILPAGQQLHDNAGASRIHSK